MKNEKRTNWRTEKEERKVEKKKFDQVTEMGPTNSVKNIEWWEVSDGAKQVWKIK